ncbi:hypothetical protein tb265_06830 [Gemmatimonadetes bacterium T265]|nr:hypothetical protein tb265_06830 [Gemmatimonadetes bacterium T265]
MSKPPQHEPQRDDQGPTPYAHDPAGGDAGVAGAPTVNARHPGEPAAPTPTTRRPAAGQATGLAERALRGLDEMRPAQDARRRFAVAAVPRVGDIGRAQPRGTPVPAGTSDAQPIRALTRPVVAAGAAATRVIDGPARLTCTGAVPLTAIAEDLDRTETVGLHLRLVRAMQRGATARGALTDVGLDPTRVRWAQKLFMRWQRTGSVVDGRWERRGKRPAEHRVVTPTLEQIILLKWNGRRKANVRAVWRMVRDAVRREVERAAAAGESVEGLVVPSYHSVYRYLERLPASVRRVRDEGLTAWDKHGRPFLDYDPATHANHIAQIDHTRLDLWIRVEVRGGVWEARAVWLTVVLDVFSRALLGYVLSTKVPDAWTTALALRHAILPKADAAWPMCGIPEVLVPDHGKDFMAGDTARLTRGLGIRLEPTPPYYPNLKAEVERFFGTLTSFLSELVGYMPADGHSAGAAAKRIPMLLTFAQLRAELERFFAEYHARPHDGLDGDAPAARWREAVHLALPPSEEDLNVLLLKDDAVRVVTKEGIRFTAKSRVLVARPGSARGEEEELVDVRGGRYWAPALMDYWKREVRVRYNPEDLDSILVYDAETGDRVCEAWIMGFAHSKYGALEVKRFRVGYRHDLKARTTAYAEEVARDDRRSARAYDEAQALAQRLASEAAARRTDEDDAPVAEPTTRVVAKDRRKGAKARTPQDGAPQRRPSSGGAREDRVAATDPGAAEVARLVEQLDRRARRA